MLRSRFAAASLSLALVAGCSTAVAPTAVAPQPAAPVVADGAAPAPVVPGPADVSAAAAALRTFQGLATFRGEALAGYALSVYDAQTGEPIPAVDRPEAATGLAVVAPSLVTDAQGRFSLAVVGLAEGRALRVTASKGDAVLETIATAKGALAAKPSARRVLDAEVLSLSELTTATANIAKGVLATTRLLPAEQAAPVLDDFLAQLQGFTDQLQAAIQSQPSLANRAVTGKAGVRSLVEAAGLLKLVTRSVAEVVAKVAKAPQAAPAAQDPAVRQALASVEFIGTVLKGSLGTDQFTLSNSATGQSIDASNGDVSTFTNRVQRTTSNVEVTLGALPTTATTAEDTALTVSGVTASASHTNDLPTLEVTSNVGGEGSVVDGTLTWTPPENFNGTATVTVRGTYGKATASKSIAVTVTPVNDAPAIFSLTPYNATIAQSMAFNVDVTDADGDPVTITVTSDPTLGFVELYDNLLQYHANESAGVDSFTFTLNDGHTTTTITQTVTIDPSAEVEL